VAAGALVAAYEDVFCKFWHAKSLVKNKNGPQTAARRGL
jgi:hypothetical protein